MASRSDRHPGTTRATTRACGPGGAPRPLAAGCGEANTYVEPPPPEVTVATPVTAGRDELLRGDRDDPAGRVGRHPGPGQGVPQGAALQGRGGRQGGGAPPGDRRGAVPGLAGPGQGAAGRGRGGAHARPKQSQGPGGRHGAARARRGAAPAGADRGGRASATCSGANAGSREEMDQAEANRKKAEAQVEADRANLDQAEADYETNILVGQGQRRRGQDRGPQRRDRPGLLPDARPDRRPDQPGQLRRRQPRRRRPGDVLATIVKIDPIYAYINVSETDLLRFRKMARRGRTGRRPRTQVPDGPRPGRREGLPPPGQARLPGPGGRPRHGHDPGPRGSSPTPDGSILPGLFVRVRVPLEQQAGRPARPRAGARGPTRRASTCWWSGKDERRRVRAVKAGAAGRRPPRGRGEARPDDRVDRRRPAPGPARSRRSSRWPGRTEPAEADRRRRRHAAPAP